jgi:hypothetical protein
MHTDLQLEALKRDLHVDVKIILHYSQILKK